MDSDVLRPGERLDDLLINGLKIIQHPAEFCFSLDAVLLAHFASVRPGAAAVDLGAGTGVLGLLLIARGVGSVTGVEINSRMAELARRSARLNALDERLTIVTGDVRQLGGGLLPGNTWELVVSNPPYRRVGAGKLNALSAIAAARHEISGGLPDFVAAARYLLKYRGRFAMVHLPERMAEILTAMHQAGIEPKRLRLVYPTPDTKPKMLLVEGVRGAQPGLEVLAPLVVYNADGGYSREIEAYYQAGE